MNYKMNFTQNLKMKLSLMIITLSFAFIANAQVTLRGTVVEKGGEPAIGASVQVKGTTNGTITDFNGNFSLSLVTGKEILIVSYIGFKTIEMPVAGKTNLKVIIEEDTEQLQEVVVVGYGTQKKVNLTGAVSTVSAEAFETKGSLSTPLQALQGSVPGVTVTRSSGAPGAEGYGMQVRGATSVNGGGAMVLIDGMEGNINDINPNDIESISVLKDMSASIYGARAAGGVVLITTKRGSKGKMNVSYKGSMDIKKPGLQMQLMGMQHYMEAFQEAKINDGASPYDNLNIYPQEVINAYKTLNPDYINSYIPSDYLGDINEYTFFDTNWNDVLYGKGISQSHTLTLSGSTEKTNYMMSVGFYDEDGMLQWGNDKTQRYNVRLNYDFKIADWLKLETSTSFDRRNIEMPSRGFNINLAQPGFPTSTIDGKAYAWGGQQTPNWIAELGGENISYSNTFRTNFKLITDITKNLSWINTAALSPKDNGYTSWENKIAWYFYDGSFNQNNPTSDKIKKFTNTSLYQNYSSYLQFNKKYMNAHDVSLMAGTSYETSEYENFDVQVSDLITTSIHSLETATGSVAPSIHDAAEKWALASYFGRLNYNYKDKYLVEANVRSDGSSRFVADKRWKTFYGGSLGWRITEEAFMKGNGIFDNLKLRGSWGTLGNQAGIGTYDYIGMLNINSASGNVNSAYGLFGSATAAYVGQTITQKNVVSESRTWETVEVANLGLDFTILGNKLNGSIEVFQKANKNMLVPLLYSQEYGATAPYTNDGELITRGWELSLSYRDKIGSFNYFINGTLSDNFNNVIKFAGSVVSIPGYNKFVDTYPLNAFFGYERVGLITTAEELAEYSGKYADNGIVPKTLRLGDMMYKDLNEDGVINVNDIKFLGTDDPRYSFAFQLGGDFHGIDFMANFQGVGQRSIYRETHQRYPFRAWYIGQNDALYGKYYSDLYSKYGDLVYAEDPGVAASYVGQTMFPQSKYDRTSSDLMPRLTTDAGINDYNYAPADWLIEDGAYLRLKNIVIGYSLPKTIISPLGLEKVRFYISGTDLWEMSFITDGWDPETSRNPDNGTQRYPFARTVSFGLDVNF